MINVNLNELNILKTQVTNVSKNKSEAKNVESDSKSFKNVLDNKKNDKAEVAKQDVPKDKVEVKETKEAVKELAEKLDSITTKLEDGNVDQGEIVEELASLLMFLNIPVIDNKVLPLVVDTEAVDTITSGALETLKAMDGIEDIINMITSNLNNQPSLQAKNENNGFKDVINVMLNNDALVEITPEVIEKIEKQLEIILPLIVKDNNEGLKKEDIVSSLKNHIATLVNDKESSNDTNNEITALKTESKVVNNTEVPKVVIKETVATTTNVENSSDDLVSKLKEEDKVLAKLLGDDADSFTASLNKFEAKATAINDIPAEPVSVHKETLDKDIIKNVKFMVRNAVQELKVKIYPKELGELTIKILSEEGIMRAEIKATSKETYNLLNSNLNEIKKALSNENIKIQDVNIGLYEDTTFYSDGSFNGNQNEKRETMLNTNISNSNDTLEEIEDNISENTNVDYLV